MIRFKVLIADHDEAYINSIIDYISSFYSYRFEIFSFTKIEQLIKFLSEEDQNHDLLLLSPKFYTPCVKAGNKSRLAVIVPGKVISDDPELITINKYQHAESFVNDIALILT